MSGTDLDDRTFRTVFDCVRDGVLVGEPHGAILWANTAACKMFAATEGQLCDVGRPGISNPDDPAWQEFLAERDRSGHAEGVVPMFRLDGSPLLAEVSSALFESPSGGYRTCVLVRDVTDRVRMERRLVAYDEITEALLANEGMHQVLQMLARHACNIFDATYATVLIREEDGPGMQLLAVHGPGASSEQVGRIYPPGGWSERVMVSRQAVVLEDFSAVARNPEFRNLGLGPAMIAPVGAGEAVFGTLFIGAHPSRHPYQQDDLDEAARYAARAGVIMSVARARNEVEIDLRRTTEQLKHALDSRVLIEQAKGYVACLRHVSPDEAFNLLRQYARSHNTALHTVAHQVLERRLVV